MVATLSEDKFVCLIASDTHLLEIRFPLFLSIYLVWWIIQPSGIVRHHRYKMQRFYPFQFRIHRFTYWCRITTKPISSRWRTMRLIRSMTLPLRGSIWLKSLWRNCRTWRAWLRSNRYNFRVIARTWRELSMVWWGSIRYLEASNWNWNLLQSRQSSIWISISCWPRRVTSWFMTTSNSIRSYLYWGGNWSSWTTNLSHRWCTRRMKLDGSSISLQDLRQLILMNIRGFR